MIALFGEVQRTTLLSIQMGDLYPHPNQKLAHVVVPFSGCIEQTSLAILVFVVYIGAFCNKQLYNVQSIVSGRVKNRGLSAKVSIVQIVLKAI